MSRRWSRRRLLAGVAGVGLTWLSGCGSGSESSSLPVEIVNFTAEPQILDVELVRRDAEDRSDATVLRQSYELEPSEGDGQEYTIPDVPTVPNQRYLVRARIGGTRIPTRHYHYVPDCVGVEGHEDRLYVAVTDTESGLSVSFDQNGCQ